MPESFRPTAYADINKTLSELLGQVRTVLGPYLVGMYLAGSLALGDFDPDSSDIDLVIVTDTELSDGLFAALCEMHTRYAARNSPWSKKLEAVYIPQLSLRRAGARGARYPVLEKGRSLILDHLEVGWSVQRHTVREYGVALLGPEPRALLEPVDPNEMRQAGRAIAAMWLEEARSDPSWIAWMHQRENHTFVVLTLCRLLYTLRTGSVASKRRAGQWARQTLGESWASLIDRALAGQPGSGEVSDSEADATVALIRHTVARFQLWEASAPAVE